MDKEIPRNDILVGDAKEKLEGLPDNSVDTAMTSPPYWGLRDYGEDGQLGLEDTPKQYVKKLMEVFNELKRVLKPTGTFYLNIDDSYGNPETSDKCMAMIPERVIMAMTEQGWILRNKIIWRKKGGGMPESVQDRYSTTWEYVYMFSLQEEYYFDLDSVREPYESREQGKSYNPGNKQTEEMVKHFKKQGSGGNFDGHEWSMDNGGKNPGDMWTISTAQMSEAHFAVYPEELVEKPVKASCPKKVCAKCGKPYERDVEREERGETEARNKLHNGQNGLKWEDPPEAEFKGWKKTCECDTDEIVKGTILDPFAGAGTTCLVARQNNRDYIGIELNEEYAEMARERIKNEIGGQSLDNFLKPKQSSLDSAK